MFSVKGELVQFLATDNIILHGLLSRSNERSDKAVLHIHGLESSFYKRDFTKVLPSVLTRNGFNFFTIELRGSYNIWGITQKKGTTAKEVLVGGDLEKFEECIYDIQGAIRYLESIAMKRIFLEGHSTGCQKSAYYLTKRKHASIKGLILIAPCDDYNINKKDLGKKKFLEAVKYARQNMKKNPSMLMVGKYPNMWLSASRFLSVCDLKCVEGRIFNYDLKHLAEFSKIRIPILTLFGTQEQYAVKPVKEYLRILKDNTNSMNFETALIEGADHGFVGKEMQLAKVIANWLIRSS
jgi:pimeloyl-ACP methyl ester carboxylesterase